MAPVLRCAGLLAGVVEGWAREVDAAGAVVDVVVVGAGAVVVFSCCLGKAVSAVSGSLVVTDAALVGALLPESFLVSASSGDVLPVAEVEVDASAFFSLDVDVSGPLATRAVSESVGFFSFISAVGPVDIGGCRDDVVGVVGDAGVTVTAGVCACSAVAMASVRWVERSHGRSGSLDKGR